MSTNQKQIIGVAAAIVVPALLLLVGFLVGRVYTPGYAGYGAPGGMMNGRGMFMNGYFDNQNSYGRYSMMPGGMMGGGMMSGGMMGGYVNPALTNTAPLSLEAAEEILNDYIQAFSAEPLAIREIMIFDNHAYAQLVEEETGIGAMEVLIDPVTGVVYPEHGPNMMWNVKYGMMGSGMPMGMMGGSSLYFSPSFSDADMTISAEKAVTLAQNYLDTVLPGAVAGAHADAFYGYYTLHVEDTEGNVLGMLSVNGYDGQVFLHTWHGDFIEMSEMD